MEEVKKISEKVVTSSKRIVGSLKCKITPKCILLMVNLLFMMSGLVLLAVGLIVPASYDKYMWFLTPYYFSLPDFCVVVGAIAICLAAVVGTSAVFIDKYILRIVYIIAMFVIFILQVLASLGGFVIQLNTLSHIWSSMTSSIGRYSTNIWVASNWDTVQRDFYCCGILDRRDWLEVLGTQETQALPLSCCRYPDGAVHTFECTTSSAHYRVCQLGLGYFISDQVRIIGVTGAVLAGIQILLIVCATMAARSARTAKITRELLPREEKQQIT